ncbi:DUF362 domain-containing protein [Caldicellulosiruptor naganoensis]|uniref:DUF362 domain-containing protein n=1 Tax=Caldicellulosiruptor naganoensis TaxID=29324 RepID=A0ABY7BH24_9FIRM|nr:DUF362 domain-containing protein [Caldicellulosiruptor naganoensis]WAM32134.1 DUF362 domain-containing protein [Caldicellulosiruptor naganoensis]
MHRVAIVRCNTYNVDDIKKALEKGIDLLGFEFTRLNKVLLKPNLLMKKRPEEAVTTHPAVVEAVVKIIQEKTNEIIIADSPGGPYTKRRLEAVYQAAGLKELEKYKKVTLNYDTSSKEIQLDRSILKKISFISPYFEVDSLINLPKLKTHRMAVYTGAVKNLFGLVPGGQKAELHFRLQEVDKFMEMLLDIYSTAKPILNIMDAIVGMEGEGPSAGKPRSLGLLLISQDAIALDFVACKIIGLEIKDVPLLNVAKSKGLLNPDEIEIVGETLEEVAVNNFKVPLRPEISFVRGRFPNFIAKIISDILTPRPVFDRNICIGCAECFNACPAQAIELRSRKAYIDLKKCIRCYCCHELCPAKAITIKRSFLFEKILK